MPAVFIGSHQDIAQSMIDRRQQFEFSYYVFSDDDLDTVIPIVAKLNDSK